MATASASGIEWLTATNSQSNGPSCSRCPSRTVSEYGVIRCSLSFASTSARVSCEPISGMSARSLQQVRHGADVVLVAVREDDAYDVVEPVADVVEVGQDQVDAGLVVLGEEHAAVDDEQLAVDTRRRPCCGRSRRGRRAGRCAACPARVAAARAAWGSGSQKSDLVEVGRAERRRPGPRSAGTSGSRTERLGRTPMQLERGLDRDGALGAGHDGAATTGSSSTCSLRASSEVAGVDGPDHRRRTGRPRRGATTRDDAGRADGPASGRFSRSSPL